MCFFLNKENKVQIATKDILVYKYSHREVGNEFSPFWYPQFRYKIGKKNPFVPLKIVVVGKSAARTFREDHINEGYHSFRILAKCAYHTSTGIFIIPAGTPFYHNFIAGEIVSSQLIYQGPYSRELAGKLRKEKSLQQLRKSRRK